MVFHVTGAFSAANGSSQDNVMGGGVCITGNIAHGGWGPFVRESRGQRAVSASESLPASRPLSRVSSSEAQNHDIKRNHENNSGVRKAYSGLRLCIYFGMYILIW